MTGASIAQWQNFTSGKVRVRVSVGKKVVSFDMPKFIGSCVLFKKGRQLKVGAL